MKRVIRHKAVLEVQAGGKKKKEKKVIVCPVFDTGDAHLSP